MNEQPERRQTPTERLHEVTMAALQRSAAPPEHAVEISRNAKGDFQFSVTVRGFDVEQVYVDATSIASRLAGLYPRENGAA